MVLEKSPPRLPGTPLDAVCSLIIVWRERLAYGPEAAVNPRGPFEEALTTSLTDTRSLPGVIRRPMSALMVLFARGIWPAPDFCVY